MTKYLLKTGNKMANVNVKKLQFIHNGNRSNYYYYNHFMDPCAVFRTTWLSQYHKGKTRKVKSIWIYWSKRQ